MYVCELNSSFLCCSENFRGVASVESENCIMQSRQSHVINLLLLS